VITWKGSAIHWGLWSCSECSAVVATGDEHAHEDWHAAQEERFEQLKELIAGVAQVAQRADSTAGMLRPLG
jgi:hypothetical protein